MSYTFTQFGIPTGTTNMQYEDWYNYCTAANVYVRPSCSVHSPLLIWVCDTPVFGAYYDDGIAQQVDWDNQEFTETAHGQQSSCEVDLTHYTAANPQNGTHNATINNDC